MEQISHWINVGIAVLSVLVCAGLVVWMIWNDRKLKRHLKAEDDRWSRAMKELRREAAERNRKKDALGGFRSENDE